MKRLRTAIMGCGQISGIYLKNLTGPFSRYIEVTVCSDLIRERSESRATEFSIPRVMEPDEVYTDSNIDLIVCLTNPPAHHYVCKRAMVNGKHAYTEKTFGINLIESQELLTLAAQNNVCIGAAPDTFLGAGIQTCRKLMEDGWIGKPFSAVASLRRCITETEPVWLWQTGAGPLLDMGPYYLTALVSILGKVDSVAGYSCAAIPKRPAKHLDGTVDLYDVEVPTHVGGTLRFDCGVNALFTTSFDVWNCGNENHLEINGTDGTIIMPDPNFFGGEITYYGKNTDAPTTLPLLFDFTDNNRGLGTAEMAKAILQNKKPRAHAAMAHHVLETSMKLLESEKQNAVIKMESTFDLPEPMKVNGVQDLCVL